jgi:hypothetical protein
VLTPRKLHALLTFVAHASVTLFVNYRVRHEKFVPLNQAVLTSMSLARPVGPFGLIFTLGILADEDATHPFSVSYVLPSIQKIASNITQAP